MTDENVFEEIGSMSIEELLAYVLVSPELISDSYFSAFRKAILDRAEELGIYD